MPGSATVPKIERRRSHFEQLKSALGAIDDRRQQAASLQADKLRHQGARPATSTIVVQDILSGTADDDDGDEEDDDERDPNWAYSLVVERAAKSKTLQRHRSFYGVVERAQAELIPLPSSRQADLIKLPSGGLQPASTAKRDGGALGDEGHWPSTLFAVSTGMDSPRQAEPLSPGTRPTDGSRQPALANKFASTVKRIASLQDLSRRVRTLSSADACAGPCGPCGPCASPGRHLDASGGLQSPPQVTATVLTGPSGTTSGPSSFLSSPSMARLGRTPSLLPAKSGPNDPSYLNQSLQLQHPNHASEPLSRINSFLAAPDSPSSVPKAGRRKPSGQSSMICLASNGRAAAEPGLAMGLPKQDRAWPNGEIASPSAVAGRRFSRA